MRFDGAELRMSGRAVTNPVISGSNSDRVTFRAISTERRYDDGAADWIDGDEFATTVVCWGKLGISVLQMLRKGDPVVIDGKMTSRRFERNGITEYMQECKADHVAFDIGRAAGRLMRNPHHATESAPGTSPTERTDSAPSTEQVEAGSTPNEAGSTPNEAGSTLNDVEDPFRPSGVHAPEPELAGAPF